MYTARLRQRTPVAHPGRERAGRNDRIVRVAEKLAYLVLFTVFCASLAA
ncbi:hypothetical protein [Kouleothrix sp.]